MVNFVDLIKNILMMNSEKTFIGLSSFKKPKKIMKKYIAKSIKKSDIKLSDLMRKDTKKIKL